MMRMMVGFVEDSLSQKTKSVKMKAITRENGKHALVRLDAGEATFHTVVKVT